MSTNRGLICLKSPRFLPNAKLEFTAPLNHGLLASCSITFLISCAATRMEMPESLRLQAVKESCIHACMGAFTSLASLPLLSSSYSPRPFSLPVVLAKGFPFWSITDVITWPVSQSFPCQIAFPRLKSSSSDHPSNSLPACLRGTARVILSS